MNGPRIDEHGAASLPLFRSEAVNRSRVPDLGEVILIQPLSVSMMTWVAVAVCIAVTCLLYFGSYTRRTTLKGQLQPVGGVVRVPAPQFGVILERRVRDGQVVHKGDVLFVLSSDRRGPSASGIQQELIRQAHLKQQSNEESIASLAAQERDEYENAQKRLAYLRATAEQETAAIAVMDRRVLLAQQLEQKFEIVRKDGYVSQLDLIAKQSDLLDQQAKLQAMQRDQLTTLQQVQDQAAQLRQIPLKYAQQQQELERAQAAVAQELTQAEGMRQWTVNAPTDGTVSAVMEDVGQSIDGQRPLLSLLPSGQALECILYAPSKAVGFIHPGQTVQLRYEAFPYQKFGHQTGTVVALAKNAVSPQDLTDSGQAFAATVAQGTSESVFPVRVRLASQSVRAYGELQPLQAGMLVDADVMHESRRLYEWIIEPLSAVLGRVSQQ